MEPLLPQARQALALLDDPAFASCFARHLGGAGLGGFRVLHHAPALARLVERNAGLLVAGSLYLSVPATPGVIIPISVAALARRFGTTRGHIRNLLAEADTAGLVRRSDGAVQATPALADAVESFIAAMFAVMAHCAGAAGREMEANTSAASAARRPR